MKIKLTIFFLLGLFCLSSYAESFDSVNNDEGLFQRIFATKSNMQNLLSDVDKRYGEIAYLLNRIQDKIEQKRHSLNDVRVEMEGYQEGIDNLSKELGEQVRLAYALGQKEKLKLILNQHDHALSSRVMVYFNYLNKDRLNKLSDIKAALDHLEELDKLRQSETVALESELERKKNEQIMLNEAKKQRTELVAKMLGSGASHEQQLIQLQESENSLKQLMQSLSVDDVDLSDHPAPASGLSVSSQGDFVQSSDFMSLKGKLLWPVTGHLLNKFGAARAEVTWDGVVIESNEGSDVKAVARGKVVFSEWFKGYGFMIIIDHNDGYLSVYGFNQNLTKQSGDVVESGDVIAAVGQSGGQSKSGLYFGIRHKGVAMDPLEWCRR